MLPAERQQVYDLYRDGKSYTEIAVALRLKKNTVASTISKGRERGEDLPRRDNRDSGEVVAVNIFRVVKKIKREKLPDTIEGVAMLDVKEDQCREIIGHLRCCGEEITRGSYCLSHAKINYKGEFDGAPKQ